MVVSTEGEINILPPKLSKFKSRCCMLEQNVEKNIYPIDYNLNWGKNENINWPFRIMKYVLVKHCL